MSLCPIEVHFDNQKERVKGWRECWREFLDYKWTHNATLLDVLHGHYLW